jgi:hypothetical protein
MATLRLDLVYFKNGRPIIVVEAKRRPIPPEFRAPVLEQLRMYSLRLKSEWSLLIDPESARIYKGEALNESAAEIATARVLEAAGIERTDAVGEALLLLAVRRWLARIAEGSEIGTDGLPREFIEAVRDTEEYAQEYALA